MSGYFSSGVGKGKVGLNNLYLYLYLCIKIKKLDGMKETRKLRGLLNTSLI